jgi:hypothetical protein
VRLSRRCSGDMALKRDRSQNIIARGNEKRTIFEDKKDYK